MKLSFGFSKKAEPKRVVAALAAVKPKPDEGVEVITSLEAGEVKVDGEAKAANELTISCKNLLEDRTKERAENKAKAAPAKPAPIDENQAGLITRNMEKLSEDDAEAMRELLKDASQTEDSDAAAGTFAAMPILAREGSKAARDSAAPDNNRDTFEKVPVEAFGMALLRGMGYDPEKFKTKPVYHDKPRDNLLGLGAKALLPGERPNAKGKAKGAAKNQAAPAAKAPPAAPEAAPAAQERERSRSRDRQVDLWPSRGLVVRIIGTGAELQNFHGVDAVVLEVVEASKSCRLKARGKDGGKSQVLQGVKISDIETRVSRDCKEVRLVRGSKKGVMGKLLLRDVKNSIAEVEIDGAKEKLPLDDVCQFMA
mmetsp:Transcript_35797/g.64955  ORF Transcript_35797/g.64955 Transcript_35797/m.64955 type:complete len:368 (+) Transcript_35797:61-1164(+)